MASTMRAKSAMEAVALAQQTKRALVLRIRKAKGNGGEEEDEAFERDLGEEGRAVLESSVYLCLDSDSEDARNLKEAYPNISEDPSLAVISGESGALLLVLQGDESLRDAEDVSKKLAEAHKAEEARKLATWLALAAQATRQNQNSPAISEQTQQQINRIREQANQQRAADVATPAPETDKLVADEDEAEKDEGVEASASPARSEKDDDDEEVADQEPATVTAEEEEKPSEVSSCKINVRLLNGSQISFEMNPSSSLGEVYDYVRTHRTDGDSHPFVLKVPFSDDGFLGEDKVSVSLVDLGFGPRSLLILVPDLSSPASGGGGSPQGSGLTLWGALLSLLSLIRGILASFFLRARRPQEVASEGVQGGHREDKGRSRPEDGDQQYWNGNSTQFLSSEDSKKDQ